MSTILIFPPSKLQAPDVIRAYEVCKKRLESYGQIDVAAPANSFDDICEYINNQSVLKYDAAQDISQYSIIVFVEGYTGDVTPPGPHSICLTLPKQQRVYWLMMSSRLKLTQPSTYDQQEYPYSDSHIFQRLSGRSHELVNFPYGPLYSDVEVGPVNEFGFRVPVNYRKLANRSQNHILIIVFGGSAAFSFYCLNDEMFSARLELKLNEKQSKNSSEYSFSVLNFGMHDNVVMQEMLSYMLFVHELKPNFVIAHDGHNDIYYGLQDDPYLLNNFDIIYQRYSEEWSKILHKSDLVPTPELYSMSIRKQQMNLPQNIIHSYMKRKRQFEQITTSNGGTFLWGIQPIHCSKGALSERELLRYRQAERCVPQTRSKIKFLHYIYRLYDRLSDELSKCQNIHLVDFNRIFRKYDESWELLWDHVHTSPAGDDIIATYYCDKILTIIKDNKVQ